jgi:hypothetical protein
MLFGRRLSTFPAHVIEQMIDGVLRATSIAKRCGATYQQHADLPAVLLMSTRAAQRCQMTSRISIRTCVVADSA